METKKVSFNMDETEVRYITESIESIPELISDKENINYKKFRINSCRLFLTYKTHINKEKLLLFFNELCKRKKGDNAPKVKWYRSAHEFGTNNKENKGEAYEHTHTIVEFDKNFVSEDPEIFNYDYIHPHIKYIGKNENKKFTDMKRYIAKEDPANIDLLLETSSWTDRIHACETELDVSKLCQKPGDIIGMLQIFKLKPKIENDFYSSYEELGGKEFKFYDWQKEIYNKILTGKSSGRKITWIFDQCGKSGKSMFARDLEGKKLAYRVEGIGNGFENCAHQLIEAYKNKTWDGKTIIFDFPRNINMIATLSIYQMMEMLCNQTISSGKYQSQKIMKGKTQVYVFANNEPLLTYNEAPTMSFDRWKCLCIKSTKDGSDKVFSNKYFKIKCAEIKRLIQQFNTDTILSDDDERMSLT